MLTLALWSVKSSLSSQDLPALLRRYRESGDKRLVVDLLECVEGPEMRISVLVARMLRDPIAREDFLQDFFAKVCEKLRSHDIHQSIEGYILTMARHELLNLIKRQRTQQERQRPLEEAEILPLSGNGRTAVPIQAMSLRQFMQEASTLVGEDKWRALQLVYLDGLSRKEAAQALDISPTVLRGLLARSVSKLREHFGERFWEYFGES